MQPNILFSFLFLITTIYTQTCLTNYQYNDPITGICLSCPISCLSCFDTFTCITCLQQYYLDNNQCQPCSFGCAVCTDSNTCTSCVDGLYINSDGICVACAVGVKSCTIAIVDSCLTEYFIIGSICIGCFDNCDKCQDFVTCTLCSSGYFVGSGSTSCQKCSNNCAVCLNTNTCTSCLQGFTLNGGTCVLPSCSNISPFCTKCANNQCSQCEFGKYLNSNTCVQGASLLCLSSTGPYHTNCQTNLYGCPDYAAVQSDLMSANQLPVCIPLHASQNSEFIYKNYEEISTSCSATSASACNTRSTQIFTFKTQKSYFQLTYHISLKIYSITSQSLVISAIDPSTNNSLAFFLNPIDISKQLSQNLIDASCFNCKYGYTIINGQLSLSGGVNITILQISSSSSLFQVRQIILQVGICKVDRCASCTTAIDCVACQIPYFLQMISCVEHCDPGFYQYEYTCLLTCPANTYPISSAYECPACVSPCLTCTSAIQCISCIDGYFLDGTSCLIICSSPLYFTNLTSKSCQPCPNPCTTCSIIYTNFSNTNISNINWSVVCSGCGIGYLLQNGACTYICPMGTFQNYVDNKTKCTECITGCSQCVIDQSICLACVNNYLLYGSQCYSNYTCAVGYYVNIISNSCEKCHYPCLTCQNSPKLCTSCIKGSLYNNTCPIKCPTGMYINTINNIQICTACISQCLQCRSALLCISCVNGKYLYNQQCYIDCPTLTYYKDILKNICVPCMPPCLECLSSNMCLSCTTGYVDLSTHSCSLKCNSTSYPDINFTCQLCPAPCIQCYSSTSCQVCQLPYILYNESCITTQQCLNLNMYIRNIINLTDPSLSVQSASCMLCTYPCASCNNSAVVCLSCVEGYLYVSDLTICVTNCPQSYYSTTSSTPSSCLKCKINCLTCQQFPTNCTSCTTSMYLYSQNSTCLQTCPSGYYGSNQQQICKLCISPCYQCYNAYLCKSCTVGIYYNKACVSLCPISSIHNVYGNTCQPCTNNCLACSVIPSNCTQCSNNGFYYHQNRCLTTCPTLYYADSMSHNCQLCIQPCLSCKSSTQCLTCINNYYFLPKNGQCSSTCQLGYYPDILTLTCIQCNKTICRTCSISSNNCTQCASSYYYDYNLLQCVKICPIGTYADDYYLQCKQCQFPCMICNTTQCLSCMSSYQLYNGNCYSQCPAGFYSLQNTNNTCIKCQSLCQICTDIQTCHKCIDTYYVNAIKSCVSQCQIGYYGGYDILTSYQQCILCPIQCIKCMDGYNCTLCKNGYYLFNGVCMQECPSLYFAYNSTTIIQGNSTTVYTCLPCPQYCNTCTSLNTCTQCLNSYIYKNICYSSCPSDTYTVNQQSCVDCISPCSTCTSPYSCITCIAGYFYFQNYCMKECPQDIWRYPETMHCQIQCRYNKYAQGKLCYANGCGGMLVQINGNCLQQCPNGYYVDNQQNCQPCNNNLTQCNNLFKGQLVILRSYNLKACIIFNQLINYQNIDTNKINISFYDKNGGNVLEYVPNEYVIEEDRIIVQFAYNEIQLYEIVIVLPYILSKTMPQSLYYNVFKANIYVYNNYQYQLQQFSKTSTEKGINLSSAFTNTTTISLYNEIYSPSKIFNTIGIILISGVAICSIINIICKNAHYRQLLDFLQFVGATIYLQIQYPPILQSYLRNINLSLFSFMPQLSIARPYTLSPSKLIQYHNDSSILRNQGILFILFITIILLFIILLIIHKYHPQKLKTVISRIKYRNITDLFCIFSLPLLVFGFRFDGNVGIGDIIVQSIVICTIVGFVVYMSYFLMTVINLEQISGLAGQLQSTQNILGYMFTPFSFLRKLIFTFVICIQPNKPISNITLLLIFTIMIMVCLFFYQPFQNQVTDYITIIMQVALVIFIVILMVFGLNLVNGTSAHYMGIVGVGITGIGGIIGLGWLGYLTYLGILKYKKQRESQLQVDNNKGTLQIGLNSQQIPTNNQNLSNLNSAMQIKIKSKDYKQSDQINKSAHNNQMDGHQDEPSASNLIKNINNPNNNNNSNNNNNNNNQNVLKNDKNKHNNIKKLSKFSSDLQIDQNISQAGVQEFRYWNNYNSDSQKLSDLQIQQKNKAPKYLYKIQKNNNIKQ